jgi:peptidoglycan hydrolase-like protein with peptidoglycan-binding domain
MTRDAVRRFQASQRLPGDGQITQETARALGLR